MKVGGPLQPPSAKGLTSSQELAGRSPNTPKVLTFSRRSSAKSPSDNQRPSTANRASAICGTPDYLTRGLPGMRTETHSFTKCGSGSHQRQFLF